MKVSDAYEVYKDKTEDEIVLSKEEFIQKLVNNVSFYKQWGKNCDAHKNYIWRQNKTLFQKPLLKDEFWEKVESDEEFKEKWAKDYILSSAARIYVE